MAEGRWAIGWARAVALAGTALLAPGAAARAEDEPPTVERLQARIDDPKGSERDREEAAQALGKEHFDPEVLAPWLRERLGSEAHFHVRLAIAYALAAQGDVEGLRVLADALDGTGHLGHVYLTWLTDERASGAGKGWDRPAWVAWLAQLDLASWRDLQRRRHLPRVPLDADEAGLAKAVAWWDGLGMPDVGATEAILARMAAEEEGYAAAAAATEGDPALLAKRWVGALPLARRDLHTYMTTAHRAPDPDPFKRLVASGPAAVPALRAALADERFTRSVAVYAPGRGGFRTERRVRRVRELALEALEEIAGLRFQEPGDVPEGKWEAVGSRVDAWAAGFRAQGELAVLAAGVRARDASSPEQARRLVARFPAAALDPIREAVDGADEPYAAPMVAALEPLTTPAAQEFLRACLKPDRPVPVRLAAARALHSQGRSDGIDRLLADWPKIAYDWGTERELVAFLLREAPLRSLERMRETRDACSVGRKAAVLAQIDLALGFGEWRQPGDLPERPQPPAVWAAAEALVVSLVLDEGDTGIVYSDPDTPQARRVGEQAARTAARLWPERYSIDLRTPRAERMRQRYALFNRWRADHSIDPDPVEPPPPPPVPAVQPGESDRLVADWLRAHAGAPRDVAESALVDAGLGVLPALARALDGLPPADDRREPLDLLRRRIARILREVRWVEEGGAPRASASLRAHVEALRGRPLTGRALMGVCRQVTLDTPEGATGVALTLTRETPLTGFRLDVRLTTDTIPWTGGKGGWIFASPTGGQALVSGPALHLDSWEGRSASSDVEQRLQDRGDEDFPIECSLMRVR